MNNKVLYVPLDERHCNYGYPYELGKAAGVDILRPPEEIMSRIKEPCHIDAMWEWLYSNAADGKYAALSLDMLVYGCILSSRHHYLSVEESTLRLNRLRKLKEINPGLEIHAFMLIMRVANYDNSSEEPDYWAQYGKMIWSYSWLSGKSQKGCLDPDEQGMLEELQNKIPHDYLADYTHRREVNLRVNLNALELVEEGVIDYLVIPKDDTSEYGFSTQDQCLIYDIIYRKGLQNRVYIYPGADEAGCTHLSRIINKLAERTTKVYVGYSSALGPQIVAKYEDRPIHESIKWQLTSAGCMLVDDAAEADFALMVNTPGKYMLEAYEQGEEDYTYLNFRNLSEFVSKIKYLMDVGKICVVGDIAYANGADNELVNMLINAGLLGRLAGYGGWNTAANTLGVVILQGVAASALKADRIADFHGLYNFHIQKLIKDWAYQSNVLWYFVAERSKELGFDCYDLKKFKNQVAYEIADKVNRFIKSNLAGKVCVKDIAVKGVKLAWDRVFDVEFDLSIEY